MKISKEECFSIIIEKIANLKELSKSEAEAINMDSYIDYNGIGMDSIQLLTLLVCLEDEYEFELSDTELSLTQFMQIKDIVNTIYDKCNSVQ